MEKYKEGRILEEDEYLLKIQDFSKAKQWVNCYKHAPPSGFMTKFNKDGSIPVAFDNWGKIEYENVPIYIIKEEFRSGWKLSSWRFGMSRNWAVLIHPKGFTLEIHLQNFLDIVKENTIINGELQGEFKWAPTKLIKK